MKNGTARFTLKLTGCLGTIAAGAMTLACSGTVSSPNEGNPLDVTGMAPTDGTVVDPSVTPPATPAGSAGAPAVVMDDNAPQVVDPSTLDPGFINARRLNNTEYNNTLRDLLGTTSRPGDLIQAATLAGFDTNAKVLSGINTAMATGYFSAARDLVEEAMANPTAWGALVPCAPAAAGDTACAQSVIADFGLKAYRRPLEAAELTRLVGIYSAAQTTLQYDHAGAIGHVFQIMLTSPYFLYRLEFDPDIAATVAAKRPLNGYELASRLSYALWSSSPDAELLQLAASGQLVDSATLQAQVDRMLADPKAQAFLDDFFAQWFSIRQLGSHQADETVFPAWTEQVRQAMIDDANTYFAQFVTGGLPYSQFLTTAFDTQNPALGPIYASDAADTPRSGFLTHPAFLSVSSFTERTAPTMRGRIALESMLCTKIEPPANLEIPDLEDANAGDPGQVTNVREKLEVHRANPACAACHDILDPIGLGLENFDAIGAYRTQYSNGDAIDASGTIQGTPFMGAGNLGQILTADPRFLSCPSQQLLSFALNRLTTTADQPYLDQLSTAWNGGTITDLVKLLVVNDTFRFRKLPPEAM